MRQTASWLSVIVAAGLMAACGDRTETAPDPESIQDKTGGVSQTEADDQPALQGQLAFADGRSVGHSFVTLKSLDRNLSKTVISDTAGRFRVPTLADGRYELHAWRYGAATISQIVDVSGAVSLGSLLMTPGATDPIRIAGTAWLSRLPHGRLKRQFISGCTICHDMGSERARSPETAEDWRAIMAQMRQQNDIYSVIVDFDDAEMADWLVDHGFGRTAEDTDLLATRDGLLSDVIITEYAVGDSASWAHDMAVEPATGAAWVGDYINDQLIRVDPANGDLTTWDIPRTGAGTHTLHFDTDGYLWLTFQLTAEVARFDPRTGEFQVFGGFAEGALTHSFAYDSRGLIKTDAAGRLWLSQFGNNTVASLNPVTGAIQEYKLGGAEGRPYGIALDSTGRIWFTKYSENLMGYLQPDTGDFKEWALPVSDSGPHRMHIDDDDRLWIPLSGTGTLMRYDTRTGEAKDYTLPDSDTFPYAVRYDAGHNKVWVAGNGANSLYLFDPETEWFDIIRLPSPLSYARMISVDHERGAIWTALSSYPTPHAKRDFGVMVRIARPAWHQE